jgi:hypothetical protein
MSPENEAIIAAHLTGALLQSNPGRVVDVVLTTGNISLERAVAKIYFNCLDALREEQTEREEAPRQS